MFLVILCILCSEVIGENQWESYSIALSAFSFSFQRGWAIAACVGRRWGLVWVETIIFQSISHFYRTGVQASKHLCICYLGEKRHPEAFSTFNGLPLFAYEIIRLNFRFSMSVGSLFGTVYSLSSCHTGWVQAHDQHKGEEGSPPFLG